MLLKIQSNLKVLMLEREFQQTIEALGIMDEDKNREPTIIVLQSLAL